MDFGHVVRARRMVRNFTTDQVAPELIDQLIDLARRAPSAGNTRGTHFVVLEGPTQTAGYWDLTMPDPQRRAEFGWPGLVRAPVLVLACADPAAYVERYQEPDKQRTGLGSGTDAWPIPYWHVDTAMATMTLLHAAVDAGLGALFFGIFDHEQALCEALGIPAGIRPIGTIAIGWPAPDQRRSRSAARGLASVESVIHRGRW